MPSDNKLELVVEVDANRANASIKSVNANLSNIEQTATKAARGASQGIDGMTASMIKGATAGTLLADAIKSALAWAKDFTVGSIMMAAANAKTEASLRALAAAHGVGAGAASKQVAAIEQIGFEYTEAAHAVQRLIVADMDLAKAPGLAKLAKDAAAVQNVTAGEALESIVMAIESGASRGLRSLGLFVDFQKEVLIQELKLGHALTENEEKQVRYNAVMREGARIQGAHAAASQTVEGQLGALRREFNNLREDIGAKFQEDFKALIGHLRGLVGWLKENTDLLEKFGRIALWVAGVLATYALASKIMALAKAIAALRLASLNPYALMVTGVVTVGILAYQQWKETQERLENQFQEQERRALQQQLFQGKIRIDDLRKRGYTDEQIREIVSGAKRSWPEEESSAPTELALQPKPGPEPDVETLKRAQEIRKRQREIERETREAALGAEAQELTGIFRLLGEFKREISKYTTFVDERGVEHKMQLTAQARENLEREFHAKVRAMQREDMAEYQKQQDEAHQRRMELEARLLQQRLENNEQIARRDIEHLERVYAFEEQRAGFERDARLRELEGIDAQTLQQKVAVEQRKAEIEIDYLEKVHEVRQRLYDMDTSRMLLEEEVTLKRLGYQADEIKARIAELSQQREDIRQQNQEATDAAIQAARENAANRTAQLVREHNRTIFESLKQQAGGVFDALLQKSQSVWSAIGNSLKTALLTAIKEVVTSRVAAMLMYLFTGQKVTFAGGGAGPGGSGGVLGGLGGLLGIGAVPVFGGTGGPIPGGAAGGWGTPPFIPSPGGAGGGGLASKAGVGILGGLKGWKDILSNLGNIGYRPERWRLDEMGNMTKIAGARGIGGWQGGALLAGGSILALEGLRRGGWSGVAMTTAGGAMIGAKFGGPLGAAIGAGIGFVAGLVRLFVKGAEEKAREKIKALYGVDISDKGLLKQIVDTAKQAFGGNLDVAIRSQQVRDLIQLYAMSTGQPTRGMPATVHPLDIVETGGSLYQSPGYSNGTALPGLGGLPTLDTIGGGVASGAGLGTTVVNLQIDSKTVGNVIIQNGRVLAQGAINAMKANAGRRELTALQVSPGLVTA